MNKFFDDEADDGENYDTDGSQNEYENDSFVASDNELNNEMYFPLPQSPNKFDSVIANIESKYVHKKKTKAKCQTKSAYKTGKRERIKNILRYESLKLLTTESNKSKEEVIVPQAKRHVFSAAETLKLWREQTGYVKEKTAKCRHCTNEFYISDLERHQCVCSKKINSHLELLQLKLEMKEQRKFAK